MGNGDGDLGRLEALLGRSVLDPALWEDPLLAAALSARLEQVALALAWSRWRRRLGGPDALSVANRVMADLPRMRFRGETVAARFLARCVDLALHNHFRAEGRAPRPLPMEWSEAGAATWASSTPPLDPPSGAEARERAVALRASLDELGTPCREMLIAYYGGSGPDLEGARAVGEGASGGTLYQRIWRCRERLRLLLRERGVLEIDDGK